MDLPKRLRHPFGTRKWADLAFAGVFIAAVAAIWAGLDASWSDAWWIKDIVVPVCILMIVIGLGLAIAALQERGAETPPKKPPVELQQQRVDAETQPTASNDDAILRFLSGGPMDAKAVAAHFGTTTKFMRDVLLRLEREGHIRRSDDNKYLRPE